MDNQDLILNRWKEQQKIFDTNLTVLKKHNDPKTIHDIRVAIKKLKAFKELYILLKKEPEQDDLFGKTEDFFDVLGRQRDIETCLELITFYEEEYNCRYTGLKNYLRLLLKKTQEWVNRSSQAYHKKELSGVSSLLRNDKDLPEEKDQVQHITEIIHTKLPVIQTLFRKPHKVRQKLKEVYYWINVLPENISTDHFDASTLHQILDDLGNWQDNELLLKRAEHFRKEYLPKFFEERSLLKKLEANMKERKDKLRKSTLNKTRRWLRKVLEPG